MYNWNIQSCCHLLHIAYLSGIILLVRLASYLSCHTFSYTEVRELQLLSKPSEGSLSVILDSQVSAKFTEPHQTAYIEATIAATS